MSSRKIMRALARPHVLLHRGAKRTASFLMTIRGRILVAFLVMSAITGMLGAFSVGGIKDAGVLVDKTYDQSLMSINFARAAATDFNAMRAAFARLWIASDLGSRTLLEEELEARYKAFEEDLA